ncbi:MAG: hypothetical protein J5504_01520 [Butyrivibrio sp.]|nr:hypothetical protein [Butyrivibrio sp.]
MSFYPVSSLLGISGSAYNGMFVPFITLLIGLVVMALSGAYFTMGLKKYESAGN